MSMALGSVQTGGDMQALEPEVHTTTQPWRHLLDQLHQLLSTEPMQLPALDMPQALSLADQASPGAHHLPATRPHQRRIGKL